MIEGGRHTTARGSHFNCRGGDGDDGPKTTEKLPGGDGDDGPKTTEKLLRDSTDPSFTTQSSSK